jgi:hypothetical protein
MYVYLASAPTNREINELLVTELGQRGHHCVLEPNRPRSGRTQRRPEGALGDEAAIARADVVLMVGPDIDADVAWKAGYARALGKRVVLVWPVFASSCDHRHMFDDVARIDSLDELGEVVAGVLTGDERPAADAAARADGCRAGCPTDAAPRRGSARTTARPCGYATGYGLSAP